MIRSAFSVRKKIRMLIYGEQFTGKSTFASQFAYFKRDDGTDFRVLYIDTEGGSMDNIIDDLRSNGVKEQNFLIASTQSLAEVLDYIKKITDNEDFIDENDEVILDSYGAPFRVDALVIDSATILNIVARQGLAEFSKRRAKVKAEAAGLVGDAKAVKVEGAGMELKDYNTLNYKGQSLILDLNASGVNYIVTCREKNETESVKDDKGQISSIPTGRKIPDGFKGQEYNVDTEIRLFRSPDDDSVVMAYFVKDRTKLHGSCETVENPSLLEYREILDKSAANKEYIIKNGLNDAVKTEMELTMRDLGIDEEETAKKEANEEAEASAGPTVDTLRNKARKLISDCTNPVKKANAQKAVKDAGLPTAFSKVTDINVMKQIVSIVEKEIV
uniref:AAA domain protein n=1 Tax=Siphoviridae sp. ct96x5 TaxID=2825367 RepID=A0A8S5PSF3_9CAUD|nr:MAG TPA: AAA domain protein [Siphoviridae sp. ct96x5]